MNRSRIVVFFTVFLIVLSVAASSFAEDHQGGYVTFKPGVYIPTSNLNSKGFDNSFAGEIAIGSYYTPNLALEAGVGYFQTEASKNEEGVHEDKVGDDIGECAPEKEQKNRPGRLKNDGVGGCLEARMDAGKRAEEKPVNSKGVENAGHRI